MQLKLVCLNLWYGGKLWDNVVAFIRKENPDILALQEVMKSDDQKLPPNYRTLEELRKIFNFPYCHNAPAFVGTRPDMPKAEFGNAILSKYPIVKGEAIFFDVPYDDNYAEMNDFSFSPRNLEHVEIDTGEQKLNVFNTQGIWGFDGDDNERRLKMSDTIREAYKGKENTILCGDFNTQENTKSMANFEKDLKNIFKGEIKTSFNMRHKPAGSGFAGAVVDMIYVSPNIKVLEHYSTNEDVTDHVPLVAVLEI
ncbi:MAG: endonuclease/exonuclease/phosphatase family protein [bacterium]|nr:endonuclease/exonuclease/phosphatase family protein [bacterium]